MNRIYLPYLLTVVCLFLAQSLYPGSVNAQQRIMQPISPRIPTVPTVYNRMLLKPTFTVPFAIEPKENYKSAYKLNISTPGKLIVNAKWSSNIQLKMILTGPGNTRHYAYKRGNSPLSITFNITKEQINKGSQWQISLVNAHSREAWSIGQLAVTLPRAIASTGSTNNNTPAATTRLVTSRTVNADGSVLVTYSDGSSKRSYSGGMEITHPDGRKETYLFNQVQGAELPDFPTSGQTVLWLKSHNEALLGMIRTIVGNDESAVQNYLDSEQESLPPSSPLYQQINKRTSTIDSLVRP